MLKITEIAFASCPRMDIARPGKIYGTGDNTVIMDEKIPMIEIMPFEEFVQLTVEERLRQNDIMVNRWLEFEIFMKRLLGGWHFIHLKTCQS